MSTPATSRRRSAGVWILMLLLLIQGLGGLGGGLALSLKPDGSIMKMPTSQLRGSPFHDYLVPGLILLLVLGVLPLVTLAGVWARRSWAWYASFAIGCALVIWILVETTIIDYNVLQPVFGSVGVLLLVLTLLPSVRRHFGVKLGRR